MKILCNVCGKPVEHYFEVVIIEMGKEYYALFPDSSNKSGHAVKTIKNLCADCMSKTGINIDA